MGQGGGQGGGDGGGGAPESSVGATRRFKTLTIGLIWLVTRGGGVGGGVGQGEAGGDWGGHQRAVWEPFGGKGAEMGAGHQSSVDNKACTGSIFLGSLKNLTIGLIWLVTRGGKGGGGRGPGRRAKGGGRWGGAPESSVGFHLSAPLKT